MLVLLSWTNLTAQFPVQQLTAKEGVSLRALSVPAWNVVWASGSKGMVAKSVNEGKTFEWMQVKGFENRDFRAMHAWNDQEAIIVAIAAPAVILKTKDGGLNWYKVFEQLDSAMFLDAIHFSDDRHGTVIGDPIDSSIFLIETFDKGENWRKKSTTYFTSKLKKGEAFFASSNSNLVQIGKELILVTGGSSSRLWKHGKAFALPIIQGSNSTGANSIAVSPNRNRVIIVGGDFMNQKKIDSNIVAFRLFLESKSDRKHLTERKMVWQPTKIASPNGYKSSVEFINNETIITCGTSGVDMSNNKGTNWISLTSDPYHVVKKHPTKKAAFLAGSGGRISYVQFK